LGGGIDYWPAWKAWSEYFRDVLAVDMCDISLLADCVKLGPTYPLENIVVICDRPSQIHMQDGLLHNEDGASWEYLDGTRGYSIRGVRVDEQIVMQPETQTIEQITGEPNAEVRRIRAERYGWHRYFADSGANVIDSGDDIDGIHQALMEDQAGGRFLYVACPSSGRRYTMPVDESCETVQQGQNYLRGDGGALQGLGLTSVRPGIYAQA
jgi:hypothetical protein